jgi:hypothetical protein
MIIYTKFKPKENKSWFIELTNRESYVSIFYSEDFIPYSAHMYIETPFKKSKIK